MSNRGFRVRGGTPAAVRDETNVTRGLVASVTNMRAGGDGRHRLEGGGGGIYNPTRASKGVHV